MIVDIAPRRSPEPLEELERPLEERRRLDERRRDRQLGHDVLEDLARRHALRDRDVLAVSTAR